MEIGHIRVAKTSSQTLKDVRILCNEILSIKYAKSGAFLILAGGGVDPSPRGFFGEGRNGRTAMQRQRVMTFGDWG